MAVGNLTFWSVGEISLPVLSRLQNQQDRQRQASTQTLTITALICIACYWGLAAVAEPLILVLLGPTWTGSVLPLQILAAIGVLNAMTSTSSQILVSFGHPDGSLRIQTIIAVLLAISVTALAPKGLTAATLGVAATFIVAAPITLWLLREKIGLAVSQVIRAQLPLWFAGALMTAAVMALDHWVLTGLAPVLRLLLGIATGATVFPLLLLVLAPTLLKTTTGALWDAVRRKKA